MATQLQLNLTRRTWGGKREGAGRKKTLPGPRQVAHRARPVHKSRWPVHVTVRVRAGVPTLRNWTPYRGLHAAIRATQRADFRVVAFSVQRDHIHLIVEAADRAALSRGMNALNCRLVRAIHHGAPVRGRLLHGRYHARALKTPLEVRRAYAYVLLNFRKHGSTARAVDPYSSAYWFHGWKTSPPERTNAHVELCGEPSPVAFPETWLAWYATRKHGAIDWQRERVPDQAADELP